MRLALLAVALVFVSCSSIPFESKVEKHNILEEYFAIAKTYKDQENYKKAIEYYEKVLGDEEFYEFAFYEIAVCNVYLKNWNEAKTAFEELLERDPGNSTLKLSLAYIEAMRGNLEDAQVLYEQIVQEYPHDVEPLKNLIAVLIATADTESAAQNLALLEERFPDESTIPEMKKKIEEVAKDPSIVEGEKKEESEETDEEAEETDEGDEESGDEDEDDEDSEEDDEDSDEDDDEDEDEE